jgi:hypothetical protein
MTTHITWQTDAIKYLEPTIYRSVYNAVAPLHTYVSLTYELHEEMLVVHVAFNDSIMGTVFVFDDYLNERNLTVSKITSMVQRYVEGMKYE